MSGHKLLITALQCLHKWTNEMKQKYPNLIQVTQ